RLVHWITITLACDRPLGSMSDVAISPRQEEDTMTSKVAESIRRGLEEALAFAEGTVDASRYGVHIPEDIDVKAIRAKLDMTQQQFAGRFGFSINTLRHWEQGRRVPEGPTRAYLLVIDRDPQAVQRALRAAA